MRWVGGRLQIYFKRSSPLLSAEAAFRRLGCSHLGTLRQCDFRFNAHRTGETACIFAGAALLRMQSFCCSCTQTRSCPTHNRLTHKHPSSERCFLPSHISPDKQGFKRQSGQALFSPRCCVQKACFLLIVAPERLRESSARSVLHAALFC